LQNPVLNGQSLLPIVFQGKPNSPPSTRNNTPLLHPVLEAPAAGHAAVRQCRQQNSSELAGDY
jgi:hypothetical protein